jgi:hypothetical protein
MAHIACIATDLSRLSRRWRLKGRVWVPERAALAAGWAVYAAIPQPVVGVLFSTIRNPKELGSQANQGGAGRFLPCLLCKHRCEPHVVTAATLSDEFSGRPDRSYN